MQFTNLTNHFLIAMPSLKDPNFSHTVTYVCLHNEEGAMGIVINRPLELHLSEILEQMEIEVDELYTREIPIFEGGPVQRERGFVLHEPQGEWDVTMPVSDDLGITTSRDVLAAMARGEGPRNSLIALGYAGWGAGQLEKELAENAWLNGPADTRIIFETPSEQRWHGAAALLGVDLDRISSETGHA